MIVTDESPFAKCESPIEQMMLQALVDTHWPGRGVKDTDRVVGDFVAIGALATSIFADVLYSRVAKLANLAPQVVLSTQSPIGKYRADILVEYTPHTLHEHTSRIVVECDGAEFHTDRPAIIRDTRRDRYMIERGYWVMRFSGSEIYKNAKQCAESVSNTAMSLHTSRWRLP
jgi:very-short-patch-repair endonuclease